MPDVLALQEVKTVPFDFSKAGAASAVPELNDVDLFTLLLAEKGYSYEILKEGTGSSGKDKNSNSIHFPIFFYNRRKVMLKSSRIAWEEKEIRRAKNGAFFVETCFLLPFAATFVRHIDGIPYG